jgi:hypothetical protein
MFANFWKVRLSTLLAGMMVIATIGAVVRNVTTQLEVFLQDLIATRMNINGVSQLPSRSRILLRVLRGEPLDHWLRPLKVTRAAVERSARGEHYRFVRTLFALSTISWEERRRALVFIPRETDVFYGESAMQPSLGAIASGCMIAPFLVPSIAGIALLDGLPNSECATVYYGYQYYDRSRQRPGLEQSGLCEAARERGFSSVALVSADPVRGFTSVMRDCGLNS